MGTRVIDRYLVSACDRDPTSARGTGSHLTGSFAGPYVVFRGEVSVAIRH